MEGHGRERFLLLRMTTLALGRLVGRNAEATIRRAPINWNAQRLLLQRFFVPGAFEGKGVAGGANCLTTSAEALHRLGLRVPNMAFFLVTSGATIRRHRT